MKTIVAALGATAAAYLATCFYYWSMVWPANVEPSDRGVFIFAAFAFAVVAVAAVNIDQD